MAHPLMQRSTLVKLASALLSALVAVSGFAQYLPAGKLKYALLGVGMLGTGVPALYAQIPRLYQTPASHLTDLALLRAGDVLLYRPVGFYGLLIWVKSWHPIAHVETFVGNGESIASRDGLGTGVYPLRLSELAIVCRPRVPVDIAGARARFEQLPHRPYGWLDLLEFIGLDVDAPGIVCSPCATEVMRDAGLVDLFNGEPAKMIAPFQFALDPAFDVFDVQPDGSLQPRRRGVRS